MRIQMRLPGVLKAQRVEIERGVAQFGRVPALGAGSRRFESSRPDFSHLLSCHYQRRVPLPRSRMKDPLRSV